MLRKEQLQQEQLGTKSIPSKAEVHAAVTAPRATASLGRQEDRVCFCRAAQQLKHGPCKQLQSQPPPPSWGGSSGVSTDNRRIKCTNILWNCDLNLGFPLSPWKHNPLTVNIPEYYAMAMQKTKRHKRLRLMKLQPPCPPECVL